MANRVTLPAKRAVESVLYSQFNFLSSFASGSDFIFSVVSVTATVYSGIDANPQAIIGVNSIDPTQTFVNVLISGGVVGVIYEIAVLVHLNSGQQPVLCGYLAVIPDLP